MNTSGEADLTGLTNSPSVVAGHSLVTPVPFIQPTSGTLIAADKNKYASLKTGGNNNHSRNWNVPNIIY